MTLSKDEFSFLESLLITPSPTGYEQAGQTVWVDYLKPIADEVLTDAYGSAAARLQVNPDAITVMIEAHCDEIGMVVQHIDDQGFLWIQRIGGSDPTIARARKVFIHGEKGVVTGTIGHTAIHLQDRDNNKPFAWKDLFIDIGAANREEAEAMVRVGDPITYSDDFDFLTEDMICGRALDNRIGGFVIAQAFKRLAERKDELRVNVLALNAVQEEIGGFGARMMSYRLMPDVALVTDVTHATDTPGINQKEHGRILLGGGPSVTHGSSSHPKVVKHLTDVATKHEIAIQHEASSVRTGTDTDSIYFTRQGIPSALTSLPLRYMHSPVETASLKDVSKLIDLMEAFVLSLQADQRFNALP
ncbi:MAG: M42 family metallopeptidase [Bacteroidetes bacterium]|nr:M42 family metallopeptidase [Bacteroidota bacterium]MCH8524416.1 M42 family metallopeptidase [Balneolales bacterium]